MLATDVNNPEFVGATNPDALLFVEFEMYEAIDQWSSEVKSQEAGKRVVVKKPPTPYVKIMRPGDQTSIIHVPVREEHKQRFPEKWLYFQLQEGLLGGEHDIPGWKIDDWPYLLEQPELLRELKFARFQTVEQIAGASDEQIRRIGIAGPGLRERAKVDIRERISKDVNDKIAAKDKEVADLKAEMQKMQEQMQQLLQKDHTLHVKKSG